MSLETVGTVVTAIATAVLAYFTWQLAKATKDLVVDSHKAAGEQLKLAKEQSQLKVITDKLEEYEGPRLRSARYRYARILLGDTTSFNDRRAEEVLNFFDDLGLLLKHDYVDGKILWSMFSEQATYWWAAAKKDIIRARSEDETHYENFAYLIERVNEIKNENPTAKDTVDFLSEERETLAGMPSWS